MRRADRLIELVGRLKGGALTRAEDLAAALEVSVRTVYRDLAALQAQGLPIEGQAGLGYVLRGRIDLPPLTFDHDQMEALALGLAYVEQVGDAQLAAAARAARGKIDLAWADQPLPAVAARPMRASQRPERRSPELGAELRGAIRGRRAVEFGYGDAEGRRTRRRVEPLALVAFSEGWLLIGWCRLRADHRVFRLDRITDFAVTPEVFAADAERDLTGYLRRRAVTPPAARPAAASGWSG